MALINCPECGKEISDKAPSCPHCGIVLDNHSSHEESNNIQMDKSVKKNLIIRIVLLVLAVISLFFPYTLYILSDKTITMSGLDMLFLVSYATDVRDIMLALCMVMCICNIAVNCVNAKKGKNISSVVIVILGIIQLLSGGYVFGVYFVSSLKHWSSGRLGSGLYILFIAVLAYVVNVLISKKKDKA